MSKLQTSRKRKISRDWASGLASMTIWRPLRILRRHGPLVFGVCLETTADPAVYVPRVHFHCLATPFPVITLSLVADVLKGGQPWRIHNRDHDNCVLEAVSAAGTQHPLLMRNALSFNDFARSTANYLESTPVRCEHGPYTDLVLVAAYCGFGDYARAALDAFTSQIRRWPSEGLRIIESADAWQQSLLSQVNQGPGLSSVVEAEVTRHKLERLPDLGLGLDEDPLRFWE